MAINHDSDKAKKTIYVTGFNPKLTTKHLLEELFTQGGPVKDITLFDTHAYILFHHEESVPYCLALFNEIELHGQMLRLSPRYKNKDTFSYLRYMGEVRDTLRKAFYKIPPPDLPPKQVQKKPQQPTRNDRKRSKQTKKSRQNKPKSKVRINRSR